jgi:hypothetical protein
MSPLIHTFEAESCPQVWLAAAEFLMEQPAQSASSVVLAARTPAVMNEAAFAIHDCVDEFLRSHDRLAVSTVASSIFPANFYMHAGAAGVYEDYLRLPFPSRWGFYALRMLRKTVVVGGWNSIREINPLRILVTKIKGQLATRPMRAAYEMGMLEGDDLLELPIHDAGSDSRRTRGQPCLSHLSFKLLPDAHQVTLTALYRRHYYMEKALGNLIGLAQLLSFVAAETGLNVGPLICHSTLADLDRGSWGLHGIEGLLQQCRDCVDELQFADSVRRAGARAQRRQR